eukprot:gnl/Spiro4/27154_TR13501_c0_g1_i1.p2 gnl/Spiro4/27154_TR13501_c0_g1~~gnl/Spiro4/27154_TR13501_c0_g1_i1.p2  ORF type:complete len:193 (-),score=41.11 gnl/Spiro4/27154_TR13501_c0_g1_i1:98-595(-)
MGQSLSTANFWEGDGVRQLTRGLAFLNVGVAVVGVALGVKTYLGIAEDAHVPMSYSLNGEPTWSIQSPHAFLLFPLLSGLVALRPAYTLYRQPTAPLPHPLAVDRLYENVTLLSVGAFLAILGSGRQFSRPEYPGAISPVLVRSFFGSWLLTGVCYMLLMPSSRK